MTNKQNKTEQSKAEQNRIKSVISCDVLIVIVKCKIGSN